MSIKKVDNQNDLHNVFAYGSYCVSACGRGSGNFVTGGSSRSGHYTYKRKWDASDVNRTCKTESGRCDRSASRSCDRSERRTENSIDGSMGNGRQSGTDRICG